MSYPYNKKITIPPLIPGAIEPDIDLLIELLYHQSPSSTVHESDFADWLEDYVRTNIAGTTVKRDGFGNILITKGVSELYPCLAAHMDSAIDYTPGMTVIKTRNFIFGFDNLIGEQCGLGLDDKAGIAFAIEMLKVHPVLKVVFTLQEEIGGLGAYNMDLSFFKNCSFVIQGDRNSYSNDMIDYSNGCELMSKKFKEALKPLMSKYKYEFNHGSFTDVGCWKSEGLKISVANFSISYINEHMNDEVCIINAYKNAINLGNEIITDLSYKKWEHIPTPKQKNVYSGGTANVGGNKYSGRYYDWDDWAQETGYEDVSDNKYYYDSLSGWQKEKKKDVYHLSEHWKFEKTDEQYIQEELEIGQCPVCQSPDLTDLEEGEFVCYSCDSLFNIPIGKSRSEVMTEYSRVSNIL